MLKGVACLLAVSCATAGVGLVQDSKLAQPVQQNSASGEDKKTTAAVSLTWRLESDDHIDGVLRDTVFARDVNLTMDGTKVGGADATPFFVGHPNFRFVGEAIHGFDSELLLLREVRGWYVRAYQCQLQEDGSFLGVWHDNLNGSGDVRLRKLPPRAK